MSVIDYVALAAMAKQMIEDNGKPCTFSRLGRDPADPTKPWRGPTTATGATHPPASYAAVKAVIFPEEFVVGQHNKQVVYPDQFAAGKGGIVRTGFETLLVAATSFPGGVVDPLTLDTVDDGTRTWRINSVMILMPGVTPLIYQMTLEA